MSYLDIKCPKCDGQYTLMTSELNVLVLFKCSSCGQNSVYAAGRVIALDQDIMNEGTESEKHRHVLEVIQNNAFEFAKNALASLDTIININANVSVPETGGHIKTNSGWKVEAEHDNFQPKLFPSAKPGLSEISAEEIRDFVSIDLNLIDSKEYFERFFGNHKHTV